MKNKFLTAVITIGITGFASSSVSYAEDFSMDFVKIPAGHVLRTTKWGRKAQITVGEFEAARFPVTRGLWNKVMDAKPAFLVSWEHNKPTAWNEGTPGMWRDSFKWNSCLDCPVTYVSQAEINSFIEKYNHLVEDSGCHYSLPTGDQLVYMLRGDQTGTHDWLEYDHLSGKYTYENEYSMGVNGANVNLFVTSMFNSGLELQPVGNGKKLNQFGVELGNVYRVSTEPSTQFEKLPAAFGCAFDTQPHGAEHQTFFTPRGDIGFSLARVCSQ